MSHISTGMRAAAARNPKHTGAARMIREALQEAGHKMSINAISFATGLSTSQVKNAIGGIMGAGGVGGIVRAQGSNGVTYYEAWKPAARKPEQGNRAAPITIGRGTRWGASLV